MNKKYEFTGVTKQHLGITLHQIRALVTIVGVVSAGDVGGYVESERNLDTTGDARVSHNKDIIWFSGVGSEFGTLTAFIAADDSIKVSRGCFFGTLGEFRKAVSDRHAGTPYEKAYLGLANTIEFHFTELRSFEE